MFLLDQDDGLYRLPNTKFAQILTDPRSCRLARFAGNRVRMTDVAVQLQDRQPVAVVWINFGFISFDDQGYFDAPAFFRHQHARAELGMELPSAAPRIPQKVVDAANRFVAQGGLGRHRENCVVKSTRWLWDR